MRFVEQHDCPYGVKNKVQLLGYKKALVCFPLQHMQAWLSLTEIVLEL